jgi:hypothetical protein
MNITNSTRARTWLLSGALAVGLAAGGAGIAGAASSDSSSTTSSASTPGDPSTVTNGPGETLLTGTEAERVTAAALAAVPDGTILRVETDSAGSPYEAHVKKADGTVVTVKVGSDFSVTGTEDGFGAGGPGGIRPAQPQQ